MPDHRFFAAIYDRLLTRHRGGRPAGDAGRAARRGARPNARARRRNRPQPPPLHAAVTELVLTEPDRSWPRGFAQAGSRTSRPPPARSRSSRRRPSSFPFEDGSFDTVVSTLVLCTVDDPERAAARARPRAAARRPPALPRARARRAGRAARALAGSARAALGLVRRAAATRTVPRARPAPAPDSSTSASRVTACPKPRRWSDR